MKRALLLTYYWPPGSGPGVQRWLKFCKYLPDYDWSVDVITVANGSYPSEDHSLLEDVPDDVQVIKTKTIEPFAIYNALRGKKGNQVEVGMSNLKGAPSLFKRFSNYVRANYFVPDARVGWNTYAFPAAIKYIKRSKPDLIITTGPPHSTHLMGERLKKMYDIPWLADFRDPWTTIYYNAYLNRTVNTLKKDQALENSVLTNADGAVVASTGMKEEFSDRAQQLTFIPNGFDPTDFDIAKVTAAPKFRIAYVGNLKSNQNVSAFWEALAVIRKEVGDAFEVEITGNLAADVAQTISGLDLDNIIQIKPFVPHQEAVERMLQAHALFLPIPQSANNKSILTGKLFEYLATRRPIIAIGPTDGNASEILADCGKEAMLEYEDQNGIADRIRSLMQQHQASPGEALETGNEGYLKYSRKETAATLSNFMNALIT